MPELLKPIEWVASSRRDLKRLPDRVCRKMGYALYRAQQGATAEITKPLKGLGAGVVEVSAEHDGNAFRAVSPVRFTRAIYVLHVFNKKSKSGIATPKTEIDVVRSRLRIAAEHYRMNYEKDSNDA
ncbi:MAG: type II toxin-antitoxin system RelE/ParE family toxin [Dongiaceae bacterium]